MSVRIGLVGCGRWGKLILRDLLACGAEVHVACRSEATAGEARRLGARTAGAELPDPEHMSGYVVATPTATHAEVLRRLIPGGRPIFVEKPMTADPASARELAAAAPSTLFVMDKWRHHPAIEAMRRLTWAGEVGEVLGIKTTRWQWSSPHSDVSPLWILAPHDLAITMHVLGRLPPLLDAFPVIGDRPELGLIARLGEEQGPQVTIDLGVASPEHRRRVLVVGTRATLELGDAYDDRIVLRRGAPGETSATAEILPVGGEMPLLAEIAAFMAYVRQEAPPPLSSAADGLLVVSRIAEIEARLAQQAPL